MRLQGTISFVLFATLTQVTLAATVTHAEKKIDLSPPKLPLLQEFYHRVTLGGEINVIGFSANHTPTTMGAAPSNVGSPHASDVDVSFATLFADAKLSDFAKAFIQASYSQSSPSFLRSLPGGGDVFFLDKGYVTLANSSYTPFYIKAGRQFLDFGGVDKSSYLESFTQLLSLPRATTFTAGFKNIHRFDGSLYAYQGLSSVNDSSNSNRIRDYGLSFNYHQTEQPMSYQLGAGYLSNMANALYVSSTKARSSNLGNNNAYNRAIPAIDLHGSVKVKAIDVRIKYIGALRRFNVNDIPYTRDGGSTFVGAKPAGWGMHVGYSFPLLAHDSHVSVGYQGSKEAVALGTASGSSSTSVSGTYGNFFSIGIPQRRYYVNYAVDFHQLLRVGAELAEEGSYSATNGGTNRNGLIGLLMLTAKFV